MHSHVSAGHGAVVSVLVVALLGLGLLLAPPVARADHNTVPWASIGEVVSGSAVIANYHPAVVTDDQGHVYVFYNQGNSSTIPSVGNIRVAKFNSTGGTPIGGPVLWFDKQINDVSNVAQVGGYLSATRDGDGNLYVAWTRTSLAPDYEDIYVSKSVDGGRTWLNAVRVGIPPDGTHDIYPTIAAAPDGNVYVAWTRYRPTTPSVWFYNIAFAMSTNAGNSFINQRNISMQGPGGQAILDSMAFDSRGRAYVVFIAVDSDFNTTNQYHLNMTGSDDGVSWSSSATLTPSAGIALYPSFAVDVHDNLHLAWIDGRSGYSGGLTVWYTRSSDRGASWMTQRSIGDHTSNPNSFPSLAVHQGTVMITWPGTRMSGGIQHTGLGYSISADAGVSWYSEQYLGFVNPGVNNENITYAQIAPDGDGTFWAAAETVDQTGATQDALNLLWWNGPPSAPTIHPTSVSGHDATVRWTAPPERDVAGYNVYRSTDGTNWAFVANVGGTTTSYVDTNLANGTYWYQVQAIDTMGTPSHSSASAVAQVGPSLQDQIDALQQALNNLQSTSNTNLGALKDQITALQNALSNLQSQAAMQSTALLSTGLEVVIVVLLILILYIQVRKPKNPRPVIMAPQAGSAQTGPPSPTLDEEL